MFRYSSASVGGGRSLIMSISPQSADQGQKTHLRDLSSDGPVSWRGGSARHHIGCRTGRATNAPRASHLRNRVRSRRCAPHAFQRSPSPSDRSRRHPILARRVGERRVSCYAAQEAGNEEHRREGRVNRPTASALDRRCERGGDDDPDQPVGAAPSRRVGKGGAND
jgi:hypothetical protein